MDAPESFYKCFRPVLLFSQFCGLMPIRGICGRHQGRLRFSWMNLTHVYAIAVSSLALLFDVCYTTDNLNGPFGVDVYGSTVFYTVCLLTTYLFLRLAQRLPEIAKDFEVLESSMKEYGQTKRIRFKITVFILVFIPLATVEHGTMGVSNIAKSLKTARNSTESFGKIFYVRHFPAISEKVPYSGFLTIAFFWANTICTFNWNFLDFFLVTISIALKGKFDLITETLSTSRHDLESYSFWRKIYDNYRSTVLLTKKLDRILGPIIVTAFFSNLYHLSLQLLRSISLKGSNFDRLYFYFSLSYLILRFLTTLYSLVNINEASQGPKDILFAVDKHCVPSLRLLQQVIHDDIYFTGNRFFVINKAFLMSVIGTVVTYQAALLQFNSLAQRDE